MRGIWKGKLWWACPAFVVQDTPDLIALYWPVGTPTRSPVRRPTVEDGLYNRIELIERNWTDNDVLSLNTRGAAHSIEVMWEENTHNLRCWYVHLQEPLRRTRIGFDTMDQMLDIVINPDRTKWHWKDEDEFSEAEEIGVYSREKVQSIRQEGQRVIGLLNTNASPFCDGWENWTPPREWGIPVFPLGWENLPI
ncbi:MAG: hypothetical protein A2Z71_10710 [Chloroflexi bacterium RBG_13_50_21]|nr:MAG: hypothetical protein A2Z71_10710 [Chloroflexi bacterium RBG_13_50_21]